MNAIDLAAREDRAPAVPARTAWIRTGLRVVLFSGIVGLLLGLLNAARGGLVESLVYAECIGLSIYAGYVAMRFWVVPRRRAPAASDYVLRGIVAVPIGFVVGLNAASLLMGNPVGLAAMTRTAYFAVPVTIVATLCLMYYFWSSNRIADAAAASADAQRTLAEARLKLLQAQIEPHMLFNTLANLRTLVDVDPGRAQAMIDQLIVYLRGTLAASRSASTTLEAEFAQLAAYLELMKVRMATRLTFTVDLPDALRDAAVPPMLLQPLVENAIKHGLEPKVEGGSVHISASSADGGLQIEVRDDGIGLDDDPADPGYGLEHVRERLRTLYGDRAALSITSRAEGGVRARVSLPR